MATFRVISLGKDSIPEIVRIDANENVPLEVTIKAKQVPECSVGDFVFIWLGSDNSDGVATTWKQGLRAFGVITREIGAHRHNEECEIAFRVEVILDASISKFDFLQKAPLAYYWFCKTPKIGIHSMANQTVQTINTEDELQNIQALAYGITCISSGFKANVLTVHPELEWLFRYTPPSPLLRSTSTLQSYSELESGEKTNEKLVETLPADWVLALAARGFLIVSGQAGTGKSKTGRDMAIALSYDVDAQYNASKKAAEPAINLAFLAVGSDWNDESHLLGYHNFFGAPHTTTDATGNSSTTNESWEITPAIRLILRAIAIPDAPHFLILDEMNLSHVERYFSKFLSLFEANKGLPEEKKFSLLSPDEAKLIAQSISEENFPLEHRVVSALAQNHQGIPYPNNLFVIGTVNIDETTYMFSPKVLDRAHVLEMAVPDPSRYLIGQQKSNDTNQLSIAKVKEIFQEAIQNQKSGFWERTTPAIMLADAVQGTCWEERLTDITTALEKVLSGLQKLLQPVGFGFAYRAMNEICAYITTYVSCHDMALFADNDTEGFVAAIDKAVFQKILPHLHGNRRQLHDCLNALRLFLNGETCKYSIGRHAIEITNEQKLTFKLEQSVTKVDRMLIMLENTGYTTFVC